jgi:hypothetical protein
MISKDEYIIKLANAEAEIERLRGIEATGRKMWHEAQAQIERLTAQRDELLAALRKFEGTPIADEAIAKAEGK